MQQSINLKKEKILSHEHMEKKSEIDLLKEKL